MLEPLTFATPAIAADSPCALAARPDAWLRRDNRARMTPVARPFVAVSVRRRSLSPCDGRGYARAPFVLRGRLLCASLTRRADAPSLAARALRAWLCSTAVILDRATKGFYRHPLRRRCRVVPPPSRGPTRARHGTYCPPRAPLLRCPRGCFGHCAEPPPPARTTQTRCRHASTHTGELQTARP